MSDLLKLLDGNVDEVKNALTGLSHDDLLKLKAAEANGKARKGAADAIDDALEAAERARAGGFVAAGETSQSSHPAAIAAALNESPAADIAAATEIDTSGAPQQIVPDVDMNHPAVDADPRANTTELQNRIDFNDPVRSGREVVEAALSNGAN